MTKDVNKILVIRVTNMDRVDPVSEIKNVIKSNGFCWFGKYGRPIGVNCFTRAVSKNVIIVVKDTSGYIPYVFRRSATQRHRPKDECYPQYYNDFLIRIRTWIRLENAPDLSITISELRIHSTGSPLIEAFRTSMSSHFICELNTPSDNDLLG